VFIAQKLKNAYIWRRIAYERLTEPLHLNLLSIPVALLGSFRARVAFDLVVRQHNAYCILASADLARSMGIEEVTLIEFGVAGGAGLLNMCRIAEQVTRRTQVRFRIIGFDTGAGMPPPESHRDHPDLYQQGDFPMDFARLKQALPSNCQLILGQLADTVAPFLASLSPKTPLGYVVIDVDYYSSARDALTVFDGAPEQYLPRVLLYLDDIHLESHNSWCGELLAINEFNRAHELRKAEPHVFLRGNRLFRNAAWIDHIMTLHVLDHPARATPALRAERVVLTNPYLR
jgi:hypothetical protein